MGMWPFTLEGLYQYRGHDEDDLHGNQRVPGIAEKEDGEKLELRLKKLTKIWIGGGGSFDMKSGNYETVLKLCSYQSWLVILQLNLNKFHEKTSQDFFL